MPEVAAEIGGPKRHGRTAVGRSSLWRRPRKNAQIATRSDLSSRAAPEKGKVLLLSQVPTQRTDKKSLG